MSKFDDLMVKYHEEAAKLNLDIDTDLLTSVAKGLGPSIYNADSSLVSSSDPEELGRVKANFLIKKLGLADGPELDAAIDEVVLTFGSSNRNKHRVLFYYLLVKKLGKESVYQS